MIPEAVLSHSTRERLRIKVPSRKGNASYFSSLKDHFANFAGVSQVEANALTGSILLTHASDVKAIAAYAEEHGLFKLKITARRPTALSGAIVKTFKGFDTELKRFTGNELDVPGVAFITLLGFGVYEIGRGNFAAPAWYTAFWYALNIFLKSLPDAAGEDKE